MTEKQYFYQNKLFSVEDDLFYENCKRIGYFEDEEEYEIKRNNYKKTVDRLEELRECNIYLKRLNKKFKRKNEQLKLQYSELEITLMNNQLAYNDLKEENEYYKSKCASLEEGYLKLQRENDQLKSDLKYYRETYSIQEYGLDTETHVQLSSPILSRKELLKENEQLKQSISHYADITACSVEVMNEDDELKNDYASILCTKMEKVVKENEQLKKDLKRCREWINSDKYDYETTLAFIKSKGYSLKDVLEYKGDVE